MSYIEDCISGKVYLSSISDYIDNWNSGNYEESLHNYLGMTEEDYEDFIVKRRTLRDIVQLHIQPEFAFRGEGIDIETLNKNNLCLCRKNFLMKIYEKMIQPHRYINLHYSGKMRRWRCVVINEKSGTSDFSQYGNSLEEAIANSIVEFMDYYNIKNFNFY